MKSTLKATNIELTPAIKLYTKKKLDMVEKYLGKQAVISCHCELELMTRHHQKGEIFRTEINLTLPQTMLRVERTAEDLYKAIDKAKDHLVELIKRSKEKRLAKRGQTEK